MHFIHFLLRLTVKPVASIVFKITLFLLLTGVAHSKDTYFTYTINTRVVPFNKEVVVTLNYKLGAINQTRFRLKPLIENGGVQILQDVNEEGKEIWIGGEGLWIDMPALSTQTRIKIEGVDGLKTQLWFLVQDTLTGTVYATPKKYIWSRITIEQYIKRLNQNILALDT